MEDPRRADPAQRAWWAAALCLTVFHLPLLAATIAGAVPAGFDIVHEKFFWRSWSFARLAGGELPMWNPWVLSGYPMHADPVQGIFYPPNWIHVLLPTGTAIVLNLLLHGLIASRGCFRLVRELGGNATGAALAALAFPLGGFWTGHMAFGELPHLHATAWAPWMMLFTIRGIRGERRAWVLLAGAGALSMLAGHVQYAYQAIVMACAVGLGVLVTLPPADRRVALPRVLLGGLGAATIGSFIAAIQMLPTVIYLTASNRGEGMTWQAATQGSLHPSELIRVLLPGFFGDADRSLYWGTLLHEVTTPAVGMATLAMAVFAFRGATRSVAVAIAVPTVLAVAIALGPHTPLHAVLFDFLPGFAFFRLPVRWLGMASLGLCLLAGLGLGNALEEPRKLLRTLMGLAALVLPFAIVTLAPGGATRESHFVRLREALHDAADSWLPEAVFEAAAAESLGAARLAVALGLATLLALVALIQAHRHGRLPRGGLLAGLMLITGLELGFGGLPAWRTMPRAALASPEALLALLDETPHTRSMAMHLAPALPHTPAFLRSYSTLTPISQSHLHRAMLESRREATGVFWVTPGPYRELTGLTSTFEHETILDPRVLDRLAIRWILVAAADGSHAAQPLPLPFEWEPLIERQVIDGIHVFENRTALPRARFAGQVEYAADFEAARARLADATLTADTAIVTPPPQPSQRVAERRDASADSFTSAGEAVRFLIDAEEQVVLQVHNDSESARLLVLADTLEAGWQAQLDGMPVPIQRVDLAVRGVTVPPGPHRVEFRYRPASLQLGAGLTLFGALLWCLSWYRIRRSGET